MALVGIVANTCAVVASVRCGCVTVGADCAGVSGAGVCALATVVATARRVVRANVRIVMFPRLLDEEIHPFVKRNDKVLSSFQTRQFSQHVCVVLRNGTLLCALILLCCETLMLPLSVATCVRAAVAHALDAAASRL